jgi:hypothetical protein
MITYLNKRKKTKEPRGHLVGICPFLFKKLDKLDSPTS